MKRGLLCIRNDTNFRLGKLCGSSVRHATMRPCSTKQIEKRKYANDVIKIAFEVTLWQTNGFPILCMKAVEMHAVSCSNVSLAVHK